MELRLAGNMSDLAWFIEITALFTSALRPTNLEPDLAASLNNCPALPSSTTTGIRNIFCLDHCLAQQGLCLSFFTLMNQLCYQPAL